MRKKSVMRGRYKTKGKNVDHGSKQLESNSHDVGHKGSSRGHYTLVSDESIECSSKPNSLVPGETLSCPEADHSNSHGGASILSAGLKPSRLDTDTRYLGVRVKMPVKDMLRNIRLAKGLDPQGIHGQASKGEKKRVNTHRERKNSKRDPISLLPQLRPWWGGTGLGWVPWLGQHCILLDPAAASEELPERGV